MTIEILNDHDGVGVIVDSVDAGRVSVRMTPESHTRADWTSHDYNVHFCLGIRNTGPAAERIDVEVNGGKWDRLPDTAPLLFSSALPHGPFVPSRLPARTDLEKRYAIKLELAAGETIYLANTLPRNLAAMSDEFDRLGAAGGARRIVYGRSCDGRDLVAYAYGSQRAHSSILVTSGFHPPEPDTLASEAIMAHLATPAGREVTQRLSFVIAPIANPDGYARGTQAANAKGINFYWHFARELPDRCPEAVALWDFVGQIKPVGYIDFHSYTFQLNKTAGPYVRPGFFYTDPRTRAAAAAMYRKMLDWKDSKAMTGFSAYAPHTLGSMLADEFDTVTAAKYHIHLKEGVEECRQRGLAALMAMVAALDAAGLQSPIASPRASWRRPLRSLRILWAGCVRPNLGRLRRGRFSDIRLTRTGSDIA